ncbi:3772_t:CDS:1, partial [Dentiscutata heterogama]
IVQKDSKVVLDNMKKAKELVDGFKNAYTAAMFNEIREKENREAVEILVIISKNAIFRWYIPPNPELYKKDGRVALSNMKKTKELVAETKQ